jgi:hypothetical protein
MGTFHVWAAIRTIKSKIGTWVGYDTYKEFDPDITRGEWSTAIGQARAALANRTEELTRPINRRPVAGEITPMQTKGPSGFLQQIEVYVRDNDTGLVDSRYYVVKTQTLRSRQFIIQEGLQRYQNAIDSNPQDYPEEIVGAAYIGTHQMIPR